MLKRKSIITGALILTAANIITRLLGFVYRIYMSNAIGAEGMGLYQLILPIYNLLWAIACAGFTTTICKLVAAENAKKEYGNMGRILKQSLVFSCTIASVLSILMFFGADVVALQLLKDVRTLEPLRLLSFALPFMAAGSCIRGYFLGLSHQEVPAVSQVLEQVIRMAIIFLLAGAFIPRGLTYACLAAVAGIVLGEFCSFLYVFWAYRNFKRKFDLTKKPSLSSSAILGMVLAMALPLTLNRVTGSALFTVENILIPLKLQQYGLGPADAISVYGRITGMAMPLIFFPAALLSALSISLVPAVSEAQALKNNQRIKSTLSKSFLFTSIVGMGSAAIFVTLSEELGLVIYRQSLGDILFLLGLMCPLWYLNITMSGVLNGLGQQVFIFKNSLLSSFINIGFIYFLVPKMGVSAFILGWFLSLVAVLAISFVKIMGITEIRLKLVDWILKPVLAALAAGLVCFYIKEHWLLSYGLAFSVVASLFILGIIYLGFIMLLGCVTIKDINAIIKRK